jgi:tetratricopeptide (TPR) repeat protein
MLEGIEGKFFSGKKCQFSLFIRPPAALRAAAGCELTSRPRMIGYAVADSTPCRMASRGPLESPTELVRWVAWRNELQPAKPAHRHRRLLGAFLCIFASTFAVGCRARTQLKATVPTAHAALPTSGDGWQREFERRVRRGDFKQSLIAAAHAKRHGAAVERVWLYESVARWRLKQTASARALDRKIASAAMTRGGDAWQALAQLAAFHIKTRRAPAEALRLIAPIVAGGCAGPRACDIARRVLTAVGGAGLKATNRIIAASPRQDPGRALRWQLAVVRSLASDRQWPLADALVARVAESNPRNPKVWETNWFLARRRRGLKHRAKWLRDLATAGIGVAGLQGILAAREVATDRLLVADILELLCKRPDATESHWVKWVRSLAINQVRGAPKSPRHILRRIALHNMARFTSPAGRAALAESLLLASMPDVAAPLVDALVAADPNADHLVLRAELLRQRKEPLRARRAANEAFKKSAHKATTAWQLAAFWRRAWPVDARKWQARGAEAAGGEPDLARLRDQVVLELDRRRPAPGSERLIRAYVRRLVVEATVRKPSSVDRLPSLQRQRDQLVHLLSDIALRRSSWMHASTGALSLLSASRFASVDTHFQLARLAAKSKQHDTCLSAYDRARDAARTTHKQLDDEALLQEIVKGRDQRLLVRWLRRSGMHQAHDLSLSWNVAKRLLNGPHKTIGRRWLGGALARLVGGAAVLSAELPTYSDVRRPLRRGRTPNISPRSLETAARSGGADLILEYIEEVTHARPAHSPIPPKQAVAYGRARIAAHLARADVGRAVAEARALMRRRSLTGSQRQKLFEMLAKHNLCEITLDLAIPLAKRREAAVFRRAILHGARCARELGDPVRAKKLMMSVIRSQISRDRHLKLAEMLERNGFDGLAVGIYDRIVQGGVTRYNYLVSYARALLDTGRVSQAMGMLQRSIGQHRRRASEYRAAAALMRRYGHDDKALEILRTALDRHPTDNSVRYAYLLVRLRAVNVEDLPAEIAAFVRRGPSSGQLKGLLNAAREANRLGLLHAAVLPLMQVDRAVERFRLELAGVIGSRKHVATSVRRLRDRGQIHDHQAIRWLREVGASREARGMAEDVLASAQPVSGKSGRQQRLRILREAMNTRLDPNSSSEALGIARLFVGRALERERAATIASEELDRLGFGKAGAAVSRLSGDSTSTGPVSLCRQGVIAWHANEYTRATTLWRSAMGRLLFGDSGNEARYRMPAIHCLVGALRRADRDDEIASFLEQLIDAGPGKPKLWSLLLDVHTRRRDHGRAVQTLRRAHGHAQRGSTLLYMKYAWQIRRDGGAKRLAKWFVSDDGLRADPWWQAFVVDVLADHGAALGTPARKVQLEIEALARNSNELRGYLAQMWASRGEAAKAVQWLGSAPFAYSARVAWIRQTRTARAAAAVLVVVYRQHTRHGAGGPVELVGLSEAGWRAVAKTIASWTTQLSVADASLLAGELVSQGHAQLAAKVLAGHGGDGQVVQSEEVLRQRLRVAASTATDKELLTEAERYYAAALPGTKRPDPIHRQRLILRHLALAGRPRAALTLGRTFAQTGSTAPQAIGVAPPTDAVTASGGRFAELVRAFSPRTLDRMIAGGPVRSIVVSLSACRVAIAAGRADLALKWVRSLSRRHDEPWRLWLSVYAGAIDFDDPATAKLALDEARRLGAASGALVCQQLWLQRKGHLADCVASRPLAQLPRRDLEALALAAARGVGAAELPKMIATLAQAPTAQQLAWIGGLSSRRWALDEQDLARAQAMVRKMIAKIATQDRREALINRGLDDLAAIGVTEPAVALTERFVRTRPKDGFAANNASYALFLAGADAASSLRKTLPALANGGGAGANALLDTLASWVWRTGDHRQAVQLQRWALSASRPLDGVGDPAPPEIGAGLPLVRLAEFELEAGNLSEARLLAVLGMQRERLTAAFLLSKRDADAYASTGLPPVSNILNLTTVARRHRLLRTAGLHDAGTPITMARARAVLRVVLRRQTSRRSPATNPAR